MNEFQKFHNELMASSNFFRECVDYTARQTGFERGLVEKDYYCSILLEHLGQHLPEYAVFKGGTCLSKVYTEFYRLSEYLDYSIPIALTMSRGARRKLIEPVKKACCSLGEQLAGIHEIEPFRGFNQSKQYIGVWGYHSCLSGADETIKIEFGLREPSLMPEERRCARTLLLNVVSEEQAMSPFMIRVMALPEIWAEKARAALTRREAAIRDFFDLDYAMRNLGLNPSADGFVQLLKEKLAVPGNEPVNLSNDRRAELKRQVNAQLRPVVRTTDFERFSFERVWDAIATLARSVSTG